MELIKYPTKEIWKDILKRPAIDTTSLEATVQSVLSDIKANGQSAVNKYTLQFDKVNLENILASDDEFVLAEKLISVELKQAIQLAKRILKHFTQLKKKTLKS